MLMPASMCLRSQKKVLQSCQSYTTASFPLPEVSLSEETLLDRPRHAVSATVSNLTFLVLSDDVEERLRHVEITLGAADAAVPDGGCAGGAVGAGDADGLAAEGVLVGVAVGRVLVEEVLADGDHLLALAGFVAARAHTRSEVGHLAGEGLTGGRVGARARGAGAVRCRRRAGGRSLVSGRRSLVTGDGSDVGG
jgi:hypothetical protein